MTEWQESENVMLRKVIDYVANNLLKLEGGERPESMGTPWDWNRISGRNIDRTKRVSVQLKYFSRWIFIGTVHTLVRYCCLVNTVGFACIRRLAIWVMSPPYPSKISTAQKPVWGGLIFFHRDFHLAYVYIARRIFQLKYTFKVDKTVNRPIFKWT